VLALRGVRAWLVAGLLAIGLVLGLSAGPANATPGGFGEEEVRFKSAGVTLEGTVLVPDEASPGRKPAMALVHGAGPHTREDYRAEAEAFARGGIVTLIYDKRTKGYSGFDRSYELLADDALAAVNALQDLPYVDPDVVGLWGLSEGAWVVPIAASRSNEVAFVMLVAATGVPPAQQTSWALETQLRHQGVSGSMITALSRTWIRVLVDADMFAEANYDPVPVLERVDQPVFALWGEKDRVEPPAESARIVREALERGGITYYTIRFFPNAEHGLHSSPDGFLIRERLALGYPETVTSWVKYVARGEVPGPSAQAPPRQDHYSRPITPLAWWESEWVQFGAVVLPVLAFATYPAAVLARPSLLRRHAAAESSVQRMRRWARLLSGAGLVAVLGFVGYSNFLMFTAASAVGPVVLSRALPWLLLQALALTTSGSILALAASWWSVRKMVTGAERVRIGILLAGGVVFVAWAGYWGLLVP
jgi:pimeloyl-ACP methyl ester carboxylesterase